MARVLAIGTSPTDGRTLADGRQKAGEAMSQNATVEGGSECRGGQRTVRYLSDPPNFSPVPSCQQGRGGLALQDDGLREQRQRR